MSESTCTHDFWLHVAHADGGSYCPICIKAENARLRSESGHLKAEIVRLVEALKPFARLADRFDGQPDGAVHYAGFFELSDLRRAGAVLAKAEGKE